MRHRALACRLLAALALLASVSAAIVVGADPSGAAPKPFTCQGDQVLTGDITTSVIVPAGASCHLNFGAIDGAVTVGEGGSFSAFDFTLQGGISVTRGTFLATNGIIHGAVDTDRSHSLNLFNTTVTGGVVGTIGADPVADSAKLLSVHVQGRTSLAGMAITAGTNVVIGNSTLDGGAIVTGVRAQLYRDVIGRYLTLSYLTDLSATAGPSAASQVCGTTVHGDLAVHDSSGTVQLGDTIAGCTPSAGNTVDGSLLLMQNTAKITLAGTVAGQAVCRGNATHPKPTPMGITVAGARIQQCAGLPSA
jgi:hypothetical protein